MEKGIRNDLTVNFSKYISEEVVQVQVCYHDVTWVQAIDVLDTYMDGQVKSFTWE